MPKAKPGGYHWKQDIIQAQNANKRIRKIIRRILDDRPGPQEMAALLTRIALATGESDEAIRDLEKIAENGKNERG